MGRRSFFRPAPVLTCGGRSGRETCRSDSWPPDRPVSPSVGTPRGAHLSEWFDGHTTDVQKVTAANCVRQRNDTCPLFKGGPGVRAALSRPSRRGRVPRKALDRVADAVRPHGLEWIVSWWSWIVVAVGLMAAAIAVQFDEPWLEVLGAAAFLILFAWMVVVLRRGTGAAKSELLRSELSPRTHSSSTTRVSTTPPRDP